MIPSSACRQSQHADQPGQAGNAWRPSLSYTTLRGTILGALARSLLPPKGNSYLFRSAGRSDLYNGYAYHLKQLQKASGTSGWTLHDLRRTFATNLAALGVAIHVTERLLNHASGTVSGVAAIYNRHTYLPEMTAAIDLYERHIEELVK